MGCCTGDLRLARCVSWADSPMGMLPPIGGFAPVECRLFFFFFFFGETSKGASMCVCVSVWVGWFPHGPLLAAVSLLRGARETAEEKYDRWMTDGTGDRVVAFPGACWPPMMSEPD